jgi:hypothetical protein
VGFERVPIIFFQKRDISIFSPKTGTYGRKTRHDKKINKNKKPIIHYTLNIEEFKRTKK